MTHLKKEHIALCEKYAELLKESADLLIREVNQAANTMTGSQWMPRTIVPENEEKLYVVITSGGATYFSNPINGQWMKNVEWWLELPESPIK